MKAQELYDQIRRHCEYFGESHYELLDCNKYMIPYKEYLIKNYPQIFVGYYENLPTECKFIFDLEGAFWKWAEQNIKECPYPDVEHNWEWEEIEFSKAMEECGLIEDVYEELKIEEE